VSPNRTSSYPALTPHPANVSSAYREDIAHLKTMAKVQEDRLYSIEQDLKEQERLVIELRLRLDRCLTREDWLAAESKERQDQKQWETQRWQESTNDSKKKSKSSVPPYFAKKMSAKSWVSLIAALITIVLAGLGITTCGIKMLERQERTDQILLRLEERINNH